MILDFHLFLTKNIYAIIRRDAVYVGRLGGGVAMLSRFFFSWFSSCASWLLKIIVMQLDLVYNFRVHIKLSKFFSVFTDLV